MTARCTTAQFLDLAEAMLAIEMAMTCGRFDGDVNQKAKTAALKSFRAPGGPRFLLATVQAGGVGLNITAANHVVFADRWFNPQEMEQVSARRLGRQIPYVSHEQGAT
jgi:SNF2 family DNA or RNA helicase